MIKGLWNVAAIRRVNKRDGLIALALIGGYAVSNFFVVKWIPLNDSYIYYQLAVQTAWLLLISLLVIMRSQGLQSLGFRKEVFPIVALVVFSVAALIYAAWIGNWNLVGRWLFYLVAVAGIEDTLFHGFAYPRLARLFHSRVAAIIAVGMLFGAMHYIMPLSLYGAPWQGVFNWLGGGVVYSFVIVSLYGATGNILDVILLHAMFDFARFFPMSVWIGIGYILLSIFIRKNKPSNQQI